MLRGHEVRSGCLSGPVQRRPTCSDTERRNTLVKYVPVGRANVFPSGPVAGRPLPLREFPWPQGAPREVPVTTLKYPLDA